MANAGGRIVCPQCGANNFDTVTTCWKCSASLSVSAKQARSQPAVSGPVGGGSAFGEPNARGPQLRGSTVNPRTANLAAVWLGLLMPYFGLPIALAFMMCDDGRRQEVGKTCLLWSTVSIVIHLLLLFVLGIGVMSTLAAFAGGLKGAHPGGIGGTEGLNWIR